MNRIFHKKGTKIDSILYKSHIICFFLSHIPHTEHLFIVVFFSKEIEQIKQIQKKKMFFAREINFRYFSRKTLSVFLVLFLNLFFICIFSQRHQLVAKIKLSFGTMHLNLFTLYYKNRALLLSIAFHTHQLNYFEAVKLLLFTFKRTEMHQIN